IEENDRLAPFVRAAEANGDDSLFGRAVAYWFTNYSVLLDDLREHEGRFDVVRHEDLSRAPFETAESAFDFADLRFTDQTRDYLRISTTGGAESDVPTHTRRNSRTYVDERLAEIDDAVRQRFRRLAEPFWEVASPELTEYRERLDGASDHDSQDG
ncbi:MAG: hypothetical protein ABEL76_05705, partial [Bradymonadaceae bacterium]